MIYVFILGGTISLFQQFIGVPIIIVASIITLLRLSAGDGFKEWFLGLPQKDAGSHSYCNPKASTTWSLGEEQAKPPKKQENVTVKKSSKPKSVPSAPFQPIITTNNHLIVKYSKSKMERIQHWQNKRAGFEKQKKTSYFHKWKIEQYYCQEGKCSWCKEPLYLNSQNTHIDHVRPLWNWGTNEYRNLVLSCSLCNIDKGAKNTGYNDNLSNCSYNSVPSWIKTNKYSVDWNSKKPEVDSTR